VLIGEGVTAWDVTSTAVSTLALSVTHASFSPFVPVDFPDGRPSRALLQAGAIRPKLAILAYSGAELHVLLDRDAAIANALACSRVSDFRVAGPACR
jgi:hypothetical protein